MALQLFSIEHTPRHLPVWETIIDDLGRPPAPRIARALGVGASTVYRWHQRGGAPRIACLALFWLTRWGRSDVNAQAIHDATLAVQYARSLSEERHQLREQLADLENTNRLLELALAKTGRGSAAIADHSHIGISSEGHRSEPGGTPAPALQWPALVIPVALSAEQAQPQAASAHLAAPSRTEPGPDPSPQDSPTAQQPGAHSAKHPSRPPEPEHELSVRPEVVASFPYQNDSSMTPKENLVGLVGELDKPREPGNRAAPARNCGSGVFVALAAALSAAQAPGETVADRPGLAHSARPGLVAPRRAATHAGVARAGVGTAPASPAIRGCAPDTPGLSRPPLRGPPSNAAINESPAPLQRRAKP